MLASLVPTGPGHDRRSPSSHRPAWGGGRGRYPPDFTCNTTATLQQSTLHPDLLLVAQCRRDLLRRAHEGGSGVGSSARSWTSRQRSTVPTPSPSPSSGPPIPIALS